MSGRVLCEGGNRACCIVAESEATGNLQIECWLSCSGPNEYIDIVAASEFLVTDAPSWGHWYSVYVSGSEWDERSEGTPSADNVEVWGSMFYAYLILFVCRNIMKYLSTVAGRYLLTAFRNWHVPSHIVRKANLNAPASASWFRRSMPQWQNSQPWALPCRSGLVDDVDDVPLRSVDPNSDVWQALMDAYDSFLHLSVAAPVQAPGEQWRHCWDPLRRLEQNWHARWWFCSLASAASTLDFRWRPFHISWGLKTWRAYRTIFSM